MKIVIDISEELYAKVPYLINKGSVLIGDVLDAVEKGTPLEAQPNRCGNCIHSEEQDGSNCYECVKGMADNFEAQPSDAVSHGRLIDADAFKQYCSEGLEEMKHLFKTDKGLELAIKTTESFLKDIDEQPTVEAQPNRCGNCIHSEEQDGSNCYECVKGMADKFEEQPTDALNQCFSCEHQIIDMFEGCWYCKEGCIGWCEGKHWIAKQSNALEYDNSALERVGDTVSREAALLALTGMDLPTDRDKLIALFTNRIQHLPSVTPRTNLAETSQDCISILNRIMEYTYGMLTAEKIGLQHLIKSMMDELSGGDSE